MNKLNTLTNVVKDATKDATKALPHPKLVPYVRHMLLDASIPDDPDGPVTPGMLLAGVITVGLGDPGAPARKNAKLPAGTRATLYGRFFGAVTPGDWFMSSAAMNAAGMFVFPEIAGNVRGPHYQGEPLPSGDKGPRIRVLKLELAVPGYEIFTSMQFEGNTLYGGDRLFLETDIALTSLTVYEPPADYGLSAHSGLLV